jgi:hypothetical protein
MDPQKCQTCHPDHFTEWSGSMHAYASDDPIFLAMEARAQRETNGAIGDFCIKCHAPMAAVTGVSIDKLPAEHKGVSCYFCHSATAVKGSHDNPITLAKDGVMRAGLKNPTPNTAHDAAYEALLDREDPSSASLCGSCHDIVNPLGTHLERTYAEWQHTLFSQGPPLELTCGECHMDGSQGLAAKYDGVGIRRVHSHTFPGVDLALTDFPQADTQKSAVQKSLDGTIQSALCVKGTPGQATIQVVLDNVGAGHLWPSGATQDRRAWVEVIAYDGNNEAIYQSGVVADGQSVTDVTDPDLWLIRDCIFDAKGNDVHMFWQAASYESNQLPGPITNVPTDPNYYLTHVLRSFPRATSTPSVLTTMPARVTMRVRLVPVGLDVLDSLVQSGDLDASVKAKMPVFQVGAQVEWTAAKATIKYPENGVPVACVSGGISAGGAGANPAPEHTMCSP